MKASPPHGIDPNHETNRKKITTIGVILLVVGIPCLLIGLGLFLSFFFAVASAFSDGPMGMMDMGAIFGRTVIGFMMIAGGAFLSMIGFQMVAFGNVGRLARYQAGETMPVAHDVLRHSTPVIGDVAREVTRSAREGWEQEEPLSPGAKVRHTCGTLNDPDDRFCKGCGHSLAGPVCPTCQTQNDSDARFCDKCGNALSA